MTRAVLDTNVIVSAHIQPAGIPARILLLALAREFEVCVSTPIVAEYDDVLRRPKFKLASDVVDGFLKALQTTALIVVPSVVIRLASDPDDDNFLECAYTADADYLVTGNLADYPKTTSGGFSIHNAGENVMACRTRIVSPRDFLNLIES